MSLELDRRDEKDAGAEQAMVWAQCEAYGRIDLFIEELRLGTGDDAQCYPTSRRWADLSGAQTDDVGELIRLTAPDIEPNTRIIAMNKLWALLDPWVRKEADRST